MPYNPGSASEVPVVRISDADLGDEPNETSNQDCCPDRRSSGHIHGSGRASGSRRGRRPAHSVPTQINTLPIDLADLNYGKQVLAAR